MKKYVIAILCLAMLTGCGKVSDDSGADSRITISSGTVTSESENNSEAASETTADTVTTAKKNKVVISTTITAVTKAGITTSKKTSFAYTTRTASESASKSALESGKNYGTTSPVPTARPTVTTTAKPTQPPVTIDPKDQSDITLGITDKGIDVRRSGTVVQKLSVDTTAINDLIASGNYSNDELIIKDDFDFDLYEDLFIAENSDGLNTTGKYFRYNPDNGLYEEWNELNDIGYSVKVSDADGTLSVYTQKDSEFEEKTYDWNEDKQLVLKHHAYKYQTEDGEVYIDYYTVEDGNETLYKREKDENGSFVDVPLE